MPPWPEPFIQTCESSPSIALQLASIMTKRLRPLPPNGSVPTSPRCTWFGEVAKLVPFLVMPNTSDQVPSGSFEEPVPWPDQTDNSAGSSTQFASSPPLTRLVSIQSCGQAFDSFQ